MATSHGTDSWDFACGQNVGGVVEMEEFLGLAGIWVEGFGVSVDVLGGVLGCETYLRRV